jgi:hypothetical protein
MNTEWISTLAVGSPVVIERGYGRSFLSVDKVTRVTPTQVVIGSTKFRKSDGKAVGQDDSYFTLRLVEPTPERLKTVRRNTLAEKLARAKWGNLPLEVLEAVEALVWPKTGKAANA